MRPLLLISVIALIACDNSTSPPDRRPRDLTIVEPEDASSEEEDASEGEPEDAAVAVDAKRPIDMARPRDARSPVDAGKRDASTVDARPPIDAGTGCPRLPGAADRTRHIVVSHPYDAKGAQSPRYEVLALTPAGEIQATGRTFDLTRATDGEIVFTPDGKVGLVAGSDGKLGVFRLDAAGQPTVVHAAYAGAFYAGRIVMDPSGERAWILDSEWQASGGGVYPLRITCDGGVVEEQPVLPAKLPYALSLLGDGSGRATLVAHDVLGSPAAQDAVLLDWRTSPPGLLGGVEAFGDDEAIVPHARLTDDDRYLLIADNNSFSGIPNRLAVVEVLASGLRPVQVISPLTDPGWIVTSPFNNAALVLSVSGDAILGLGYSPGASPPFTLRGPIAYQGKKPALPTVAVRIDRGQLRGRVLVAENVGIRQVQFVASGEIMDLGMTGLGAGYTAITGALGVQP